MTEHYRKGLDDARRGRVFDPPKDPTLRKEYTAGFQDMRRARFLERQATK